jgi:hypothetical protein
LQLQKASGDSHGAVLTLRTGLQYQPDYIPALFALATALSHLGDFNAVQPR